MQQPCWCQVQLLFAILLLRRWLVLLPSSCCKRQNLNYSADSFNPDEQ
jgi:hypothetical protein